jgi:lipoprotein-releasing system permease protein
MYKLLLCWRYLRTRYIALVSIVSVMLGVATMIVVNAVMEGFTHEMQDRIHGILSDIVFESRSLDGIPDADRHMEEIRKVAGQYIAGMSPTVHVPAMLGFTVGDEYVNRQISLIGVDEATYASVSDFGRYLQHPDNRKRLDFELKEGGYDTYDHDSEDGARVETRPQMKGSGWPRRRQLARFARPVVAPEGSLAANPFGAKPQEGEKFDPAREQHPGCVLGIALCDYKNVDGSDSFLTLPGDDVEITYPSAGKPPKPLSAKFTVVDFYESKMNEYDSSFVFVPIRKLQELRGMVDPTTGVGSFNSIQIRLKPGTDLDAVRDILRNHFSPQMYVVSTWRDKEGALLSAVQMETAVLNVLLFLIIAVAGFGILAIFFMIVVEKTRDIGILKSLGATGRGIMSIFLAYGLSLGIVGAGVGMVIGLLFVKYINEIADLLGRATGRPVFDPSIYYFRKIPTFIDRPTVAWVVVGAMAIAVLASILPARRAARLHPVEALRYE